MDDRKPPSQAKDCEVPADGGASSEERGGAEGDPLKPPEGAPAAPEPEAKEPPQACGALPRRCALCNCGGWSLHGQRELQRFEPAPDWNQRLSELPDSRGPGEPRAPGDALSLIGFAEGVSPGELFEPTGHCWAHHWCAAWSVGVQLQAGAGLSDVGKAVFSGISQKCEHCRRMGATIQCHSEGCPRQYHFPCAAASGAFQSMKTLQLLCPEHVAEAVQMEDSRCMVCDGPGDLRDLLFCTSCGLHYHGTCLDIPVTPHKRSGWQCPECKVCQTCRQPGADSMMLVCEACDKGYHTFCLKPAIESLPTDSWKCKNCRVCSDCGSRPAALDPGCHWYESYSVCEGCQRHRSAAGGTDAARCCQSCQKPLPPDSSDAAGGSACPACQGQQKHPQLDGAVPQEEMPSGCEAKPLGPAPEPEEAPGPAAPAKDEATEPTPPEMAPEPPALPPAPPDPAVAASPARSEEPPPDAKEEPAPKQPAGPPAITAVPLEPAGSPQPPMDKEPASPPRTETPPTVPLPGSPAPQLGPPQPRETMECGEEEGMDTAGGEAGSLASPAGDGAQSTPAVALGPFPGLAQQEEEEGAAGPEQAGAGGRCSPPLSEDGLEESRGGGDPESSQTPVSFTSEPKGSPMLLEPEELGPATPMEVYGTGGKLLERGEEGGPEPPVLRPRPTLIKSDIVNEISNLSQGDTRSSFPGSEPLLGSPDPEGGGSLSMELGMTSTDISLQKDDAGSLPHCTDSLAETDDSLLFEPGTGAKGEGEKGRRRSSPGRSRVKQGRSSSFPGRRRPRGGTQGGRGRGRARLKSTTSSIETLALADIDSSPSKEDDEEEDDTMQNTVVLFSNTDKFVLMQDMCVVCGSFGRGAEGHLLACSQCSQCYHPYCVNSKITKVMLLKGWRCVECIVCEVCGKASDPSRLLLCDDCDISYHTYCLDPPLHTVPKGGWKCKWCVCCVQCGAGSPGFHCEWQNNSTHCAPCASLVTCPLCRAKYVEDDLLIQCRHCDRWIHAVCSNLFTEEEVEQAADEGFDCSSCQPYVVKPVVPVAPPEIIPVKIKEPEPQYFRFEGVWLTETGMAVLRNLSMSPLHKRRQRKTRLGPLNGEGGLEGGDPLGADEKKDGDLDADDLLKGEGGVEHMECEIKLEAAASPDRDGGADVDSGKGLEDSEECKKRKRKPYRPGIGGFMVRQRKSHTRLKKGSAALVEACREVLSAEGHPEDGAPAEIPAEGAAEQGATEVDEKKKRRGRKKSKLEDMFPAYLQEAFFGKALMDLSRKALLAAGGVGDGAACPPFGQGAPRPRVDPGVPGTLQKVPGDGKETPAHLKGDSSMDSSTLVAQEEDPKGAEAKAEDPGAEEPKGSPDPGDSEKPATPGEGALSSDLDKIPTEELPKMESKDIQQLFKDVLGSAEREQQLSCVAAGMEASMGGRDANRAQLSQRPFLQGSVSLGSLSSTVPMESYSGVCQSPFLDNRERSGFFSPDHCEPESPWASSSAATTPSTPTTPTTEGEGDGLSYNQRSLQRWEKDEELGELSTISPVLYANMNFPSLKQDYPDWSSRCKQIMKLWRKVPAPDKAPYLQKAKDNRAAHRINKVQKQAESQINKQTKGEVLRKPERPALHLRIPPQQGALPGAAGQPVYINSPLALPGSTDGFLKSPAGAEPGAESSELSLKLPSQVPSHDPYSMAPTYPLEPRFPSPLGQSPTAGAAFQPFPTQQQQQLLPTPRPALGPQPPEFHPTSPGPPRHQPSTPDPFLKPRCLSGSLDNLSVPGSPGARPPEPLLSPPPFGEQKRSLEAGGLQVKKEEGGPGVCSPGYVAAMGYADSPSHLSSAELKAADVFKAPLTPRVSQVEPQSPGLAHPHPQALAPSPPSHPDLYRQSPSVSCYSDPYAQPPLTPRPQPPESCCALPPRSLPSDPFSRVPASPQSQSSSQSPLTPRPLSNEACCQSPVTPRFQSPDPYSRPPSRPQSRDPFAPLHKPPRPQMPDSGFKSIPVSHNPPAGGGFPPAQPSDPHSKGPGSQQPPFARSPGASVFPGAPAQMRFTFPPAVSETLKGSPSHQPHGMNSHFASSQPVGKPQSTNYASSPGFHQAGSPLGPGNCPAETYSLSPLRPPSVLPQQPPHPQQQQDSSLTYLPRAGMVLPADKRDEVVSGISALPSRELPELPVSQEGTLGSVSQSELEKQRQRQRLRELLIRQQIQRNNLRQEKESAAAATSSSQAAWSAEASSPAFEQLRGLAPYQPAQDKSTLGNLPAAPGSSKLSGPVMVPVAFAPDERLSRPPPAATPSSMDLNGRPAVGAPQTFFPRGMFQGPSPQQQQMWQQQAAVRLPSPARFQQPPGHELGRPALGGLAGRVPGPAEQIPSSPGAMGAQFIELRHNSQKGAAGGMGSPFVQQGPPARPRFFLPGDESSSQALRASVMPLAAPVLQPPKLPAPLLPSASSPQGAQRSHQPPHKSGPPLPPPASGLELQHGPPRPLSSTSLRPEGPKDSPAMEPPLAPAPAPAPSKSHLALEGGRLPCEVPGEPDLDDDFDSHKDLEDDDLANLSLDPDVAKGDDDLGNLDNLETNDPHLDDLLNGDEFDLLAYTDPELDTGDKKDIFNEHLRLVESANEKAEREALLKREPAGPCPKGPGEPKELAPPREGLAPAPCPSSTAPAPHPTFKAQASILEAKPASLPASVQPKLEDGCLKTSPCQFNAGASDRLPVPIKSEALQGAEKMAASLGLTLKPGQNLLNPGAGPVRLGTAPFPNNSQPATSGSDKGSYAAPGRGLAASQSSSLLELDGGALGLANAQHSPADDLEKMESSLVASELPLLIEDLLEHEKKELQKKQQMSAHLPGGAQHLQTVQQHSILAHPAGPAQPPDGQAPRLVGPQQQLQLGLIARQQNLVPTQQLMTQQQRVVGSQQGQVLAPHMAQPQPHVLAAQHGVQPALTPQPNQQQVLVQKQIPGVQPTPMGMKPQQLVMQQHQLANSFFPDTDLDKFAAEDIMDPIAKAKMVALKGIKKVMAQGSIGVAPGMNRQQVSLLAQRLSGATATAEMQNHVPAGSGQERSGNDPSQTRPNPPTFAQGVINEADQRQYEEWLFHTQQLLQMQLKVLEEQIGVHRKSRKALCAKQRTAKKAGREFPEADAEKLKLVTEQQSKIQKQLDQVRKQQKEHTNLMAEYRNKQQQHQQSAAALALSPSQSPRLLAKLPGQLLAAHGVQPQLPQQTGAMVGAQGLGQQPNQLAGQAGGVRLPQGGVSMAVQQGLSFLGNAAVPSTSSSFFPGSPALRGLAADTRLMQERQLQRMQLAQKLQQQQSMLGQVSLQQQQSMLGQVSLQQPQQQSMLGQVSLQQPQQQSMLGQVSLQQPQQQSMLGQVSLQQPQQQSMLGQVSLQQPQQQSMLGQVQQPQQQSMLGQVQQPQQQSMLGQVSSPQQPQQQSMLGQVSSPQQPQQSMLGQVSSPQQQQQSMLGQVLQPQQQQQNMLGQVLQPQQQQQSMLGQVSSSQQQQQSMLGQVSSSQQQQQSMLGQVSSSQQQQQQQSMLGQVSQPQQQSMLGQVQQQQQPPAPQQGGGGQPMVPKQQGILVQQLSPQPGMMGHSQASMLQHQGVVGRQNPPRQVLLAPHQQRVLGSPQLVQQTQGLVGHRLILSPAQQQQAGLLGQSRPLLMQQQQSSRAQHQALLGQGQAAQPGLVGQGQAPKQQLPHFPQHGALGQSPSMPHLSQGGQPAPQGAAAKEQQGGAESTVLPPEGAEGRGQHQVQLTAAVGGPGSQDLGGQPHMGPQEQPGIQNLSPLALASQEQQLQKHQPELGQQPAMASSLQLQQPQRMQGGQQQSSLLHPPLQNSGGLAQLGGAMRQEQPHSDPAQGPHLLAPQGSVAEQQQQPGSMTSQAQRIAGQPPTQSQEQQPKGPVGQRLPSPAGQHKAGPMGQPQQSLLVPQASHAQNILSQVSAPVMGQFRAQLQGVISKSPQLRHLTPQQQQQLQAILVQRHQQSLLQQSQALRQAGPFPGQGQASLEQGPHPPSALQASVVRQQPRQPGTVFHVRPAGPSAAAEQMQPGFAMEQATTGQQRVPLSAPQQPLAELVHTALVGRSPQQGVLRLSAPPAATPVQAPMSMVSLGSVHQHPPPSREQSPQEPKEASPPTLARPPSVAQSPGAQPEHRLTPTQNSFLVEPVPAVPKPPPSQTGEESFAGTPGHWEPAVQGPNSSPSMEPMDGSRKPLDRSLAGSQVNGQVVERPGPQASPLEGGALPTEAPGVCIKQEPKEETAPCVLGGGQAVKREANGEPAPTPANKLLMGSQLLAGARSEAGHLLLQKLLRAKNVQLASQRSAEGLRSELNGHSDGKLSGLEQRLLAAPPGREDPSASKKPPAPKPKRAQKSGERVAASRKKLRKEDGLKSSEALMKQLKQELSLLPLVEPTITANFSLFAPFGSSPINGKSQLKGAFGSAVLDSVPDYYTQLLTKNNLSNPPTPPSSLPPTPPPSVQQKMVNGVTSSEELAEQPKEPDQAREAEGRKDAPAVEVKSLDLLAALPTPPHNQTEDVRMESDEESDSPDSIVPASSPESVLGEEPPRFPLLAEAKPELQERVLSPVIPIIPRASIPVFPDPRPPEAREPFGEHGGKVALAQGIAWEKGKGSEVSVMLTVSAAAAKNLNGVMVAVAELLRMRIPSSYEVLFPESPVRGSGPEAKKVETDGAGGLGGKAKAALAGKSPDAGTEWLKQFDAMLPGYSLKNELDILTLLKQESPALEKAVQHCYVNNVSNLDVRQLSVLPQEPSPPLSPLVPSPASPAPGDRIPEAPPEVAPAPPSPPALSPPSKEEAAHSPPKLKQRSRPPEEGEEPRPRLKKWKGVRWKRLRFLITIQKGGAKQDGEKEISEFIEKLGTTLRPEKVPRDLRKCCFCHEEGDGATDGPARLLNLDLDLWVHLNCALWSTEVYETQGGALINVEGALHRGLLTKCSLCQKTGATNSCNRIRCPSVYHFACAIRAKCMFFKDKTMLCPLHKLKGPCEQELSTFTVFRRVYIERDEVKQIASIIQRGERLHMFRVGGLLFHAIGQLLPHQMGDFHSVTALYPVGFEATRIYWSLRTNNRRCCYRCTVCENNGRPEFVVQAIEQGLEDLVFTDASPQAVWNRIIEPVAAMRKEADMLRLFPEYLKGEELFGLTVHAVLRIAESLPGVESCQNYLFRYGRHPLMELPLMINPTGCARSEPKILTHYKRPHTLNSTSMSKAYQSTFTGETNTPYSKQFVHSKSSQYRRLKTEWKNNVYLARSRIQGLGLYAAKDLEKHTMVIEYIGTIIRNEVANRREKIYEEQNRGIYMFRINNEHVIDATLTGGPARYINHSCAPNCVAEVVTFDKEDKIIIISSRRIPKGEELTYDYQFDFEDDQHKIPCHCGAWNCRKWMN
ncbi:histone-lysine N-methyltransferase 2D isoform X1 [Lepidochelys kempii]|uniref:histone-lysine N-methyltransferase 2D isoform X1 n=1 Tax=Lepidochelys kempii TaxID=8472 RepID=UPI003C6FA25B